MDGEDTTDVNQNQLNKYESVKKKKRYLKHLNLQLEISFVEEKREKGEDAVKMLKKRERRGVQKKKENEEGEVEHDPFQGNKKQNYIMLINP